MAVPISNVTRRQVYSPSGAGGAGPYSFTFEILANTDIAVYKDDTLLTLTTHYTVTINANGTGSVTITAAGLALSPTSPTQYAIVGNRTIQRTSDFTTGGDFFANTINDELDQQTIFAQQNAEGLARALTAPQTDPTSINMTLPSKANRALKTLSFDANGDPTPGISAADVANATTYATNAANSATAAAASASSASSSASAASASASTASTQASNASTSATNASNSASSASTSATNAASSASTASTQASNASTSATNAASSASAASTSAANAATSATNASNSASTATTQASNAASSASSASTSATSAANSAAAAASALDSFDDRYLGTKSSDPTLDNDGNALVAGALYFSTTQNVMKVYDGASWITATSAGATSLIRFRYVATSGQTTFSGADAASATLTYTVNNIVVMRNGVTLDTSEYTASNGTSIVLSVAAGTGDIVDIIAFKSFTVADALSAVSGGTVNGAVTITGALTANGNVILGDASTDTLNVGNGGLVKDASGNVGIGTASPAGKLHVVGSQNAWSEVIAGNTTSAQSYGMRIQAGTTSADTSLLIRDATNTTDYLAVIGNGSVGIGTSSPNRKLYVQSDDSVTGGNVVGVRNSNATAGAFINFIAGGSNAPSIGAKGDNLVFTADGYAGTEWARFSSGNLLVGATNASQGGILRVVSASAEAGTIATFGYTANGSSVYILDARATGQNNSGTAMLVLKNTSTSRSISAAGTINASGADYAEYMTKAGNFTIAKGDVVGIDAQGNLTNVFDNAVSFMVKSTDPSYVGGDSWGSEEAIGLSMPKKPSQRQATEEVEAETDGEFAVRQAQYETDKNAFDAALEAARQLVDRIAFAGQVPVNVTGATAGQYIIPVNDNGAIKGEAVNEADMTLSQYMKAVGKVIAIESDGRAKIIVKVA